MKIRLIDFGVAKEHCPFRPHENDAGADVYIPFDCTLKPGDIIKIPLGFGLEIPDGYAGYVFPGSSLAVIGDSPVFQPLRTDQYLSAAIAAAPPETVAVFSLICPLHNCQFSVSHSDQIHFFCHAIPSFLLASTGNRQPLQPAPQRGQQKPPVDTVPASFPFSVSRLTALFPPHRARGFPEPADGVY